jgi:hypothetical protein
MYLPAVMVVMLSWVGSTFLLAILGIYTAQRGQMDIIYLILQIHEKLGIYCRSGVGRLIIKEAGIPLFVSTNHNIFLRHCLLACYDEY